MPAFVAAMGTSTDRIIEQRLESSSNGPHHASGLWNRALATAQNGSTCLFSETDQLSHNYCGRHYSSSRGRIIIVVRPTIAYQAQHS